MKQEFEIDLDIYNKSIINQAIYDFKEISDIKLDDWKLEITWDSNLEIEEIFNELMNYIIWLINE